MTYTSADLQFDPETHTSRLPDGRVVPHVTAILSDVGVATDFDELASLSARMGRTIEEARVLGSAVHADCHAYDDDDLDEASVDDRVRPYLDAWKTFRANRGIVPVARATRERLLFHAPYCYAGIMDGLFTLERDRQRRILIDIKTGDPNNAACHLQTAAYAEAYRSETHEMQPIERWGVWLRPDRTVPYMVSDYSARFDDFLVFTACLTVYNHKPNRRMRVCA